MNHLSRSELIDLLDGQLAAERAQHADRCADCRNQADGLRSALSIVETQTIPEPSPLFWDHLSARIGEAIDREPLPQSWWVRFVPDARLRVTLATTALVCIAALAGYGGWTWRSMSTPAAPRIAHSEATPPSVHPDAFHETVPGDAWDVIAAAAEELEVEEAHAIGIAPRPGPVERVTLDLTPEERFELVRLIEDEMKGNGS